MEPEAERLTFVHPGEILLEEFMKPAALTVYRVAKDTGLQQTMLARLIRGERSVTPATALVLGRYFSVSPEFWMNLQASYDLRMAREALAGRLASILPRERVDAA